MCTYCMIGDWQFKRYPPWNPQDPITPWPPQVPIPAPTTPIFPWSIGQLREFQDLLKRVKDLEDRLGCPCEPNKADYLTLIEQRITALESKKKARRKRTTTRIKPRARSR